LMILIKMMTTTNDRLLPAILVSFVINAVYQYKRPSPR